MQHYIGNLICCADKFQIDTLNQLVADLGFIDFYITTETPIIENTTMIHRDSRSTLGHSFEQITIELRNLILTFSKVLS